MSDYHAETARIVATGDPLSEFDRMIVGNAGMQLRFTVMDQMDLRRIGIILRELGTRFEVLSDPKRYKLREALFNARGERAAAQNRLRSKPKSR